MPRYSQVRWLAYALMASGCAGAPTRPDCLPLVDRYDEREIDPSCLAAAAKASRADAKAGGPTAAPHTLRSGEEGEEMVNNDRITPPGHAPVAAEAAPAGSDRTPRAPARSAPTPARRR